MLSANREIAGAATIPKPHTPPALGSQSPVRIRAGGWMPLLAPSAEACCRGPAGPTPLPWPSCGLPPPRAARNSLKTLQSTSRPADCAVTAETTLVFLHSCAPPRRERRGTTLQFVGVLALIVGVAGKGLRATRDEPAVVRAHAGVSLGSPLIVHGRDAPAAAENPREIRVNPDRSRPIAGPEQLSAHCSRHDPNRLCKRLLRTARPRCSERRVCPCRSVHRELLVLDWGGGRHGAQSGRTPVVRRRPTPTAYSLDGSQRCSSRRRHPGPSGDRGQRRQSGAPERWGT